MSGNQGRAHLQFASLGKRGELCGWMHGWTAEAEARESAANLMEDADFSDVAILLVKDSGEIETLQMPLELSTISLESISKSLTVGTSTNGKVLRGLNTANESERKETDPMMTIGLTVQATEQETLAKAKETIASYFQAFAGKAEKVTAAARQVFADDPTAERIKQSILVGGVQYLTNKKDSPFHVSGEVSEDEIVSILSNAGFDGIGKRGAKGVGRPAPVGAPAAAAAPVAEVAQTALPANNKGAAPQKQARA